MGGNDKVGAFGVGLVPATESFHPNESGHLQLTTTFDTQFGFGALGTSPNPAGVPATAFTDRDTLFAYVKGNNPDTDVIYGGGAAVVKFYDAPSNTVIFTTTFSLPEVRGRATTDANGEASIPIRLSPNAAPGIDHIEVWTEDGERLVVPMLVSAAPGCEGTPDADGDRLKDACDGDATDGPSADADTDTVANALDNCRLQANPGEADADDDGEGDACDPTRARISSRPACAATRRLIRSGPRARPRARRRPCRPGPRASRGICHSTTAGRGDRRLLGHPPA